MKHEAPKKRQDQSYPHVERKYGAKQQYAEDADTQDKNKTYVQQVVGTFLYYARAVNCTMLCALGSLASQQANPIQKMME